MSIDAAVIIAGAITAVLLVIMPCCMFFGYRMARRKMKEEMEKYDCEVPVAYCVYRDREARLLSQHRRSSTFNLSDDEKVKCGKISIWHEAEISVS